MVPVDLLVNNKNSNNFTLNEEYILGIIEGVQAISRTNNLSSIIVDFNEHKTIFMSEKLLYLDEVSIFDYKRNSEIPYWSLVSDDVLEKFINIYSHYHILKDQMTKDSYNSHLCIMDFPILIKNKLFFINSRFTPIVFNSTGEIRIGVFTFVPSNKNDLSFLVVTPSGNRWSFDFTKNDFFKFNLDFKLTLTEKAILQRAKKGMSNQKIADDLFLSLNTIKSHRLSIFKKLNVTTITEALLVIGNYQLL